MTADPALYDRLERLAAEATPGQWEVGENGEIVVKDGADPYGYPHYVTCDSEGLSASVDEPDAALIVALHAAAPDLIAAARRATDLEQRVQALAEELDEVDSKHFRAYEDAAARLRGLLDGGAGR